MLVVVIGKLQGVGEYMLLSELFHGFLHRRAYLLVLIK